MSQYISIENFFLKETFSKVTFQEFLMMQTIVSIIYLLGCKNVNDQF